MKSDILLIGFGPGTVSFINNLSKYNIKHKVKITILEKNKKNFYGGIAYSENGCEFGFFNNPLRLSPNDFQKWLQKKTNRIQSIDFLQKINNYSVLKWVDENKDLFIKLNNKENFKEIYIPRVLYSFYLKKIFYVNKLIDLNLIYGELISFEKKKDFFYSEIKFKKNYIYSNCQFNNNLKNIKDIRSNYLITNTSIVRPKNFGNYANTNYIKSFYEEGATKKLLDLVNKNSQKKITIGFLGSKAGFLEPLIEISRLLDKNKKIELISFSKSGKTLQAAERSNFQKLNLFYLNKIFFKKKIAAIDIYQNLLNEFEHHKQNHNKYDVWTKILSLDVLKKLYLKLNDFEKQKYSEIYFPKIRQLTRFTYPETVNTYKRLKSKGCAKIIKSEIKSITSKDKKISIQVLEGKKIKNFNVDILVNVTGINKSIDKNNYQKKKINLFNLIGAYTKKNEHLYIKNLFIPSTFSINFNPSRYTILKAITLNNKKIAKAIYLKLNSHSK